MLGGFRAMAPGGAERGEAGGQSCPPRDLTSLGWVGAQGPAEKNGSTAQPQRPAQAPWGVTDPRISPVHPPTPHSSPHLPVQRAARAQQSRGRSSRAGGPDIPAGRDGAQHRAHRDAPPEPRNGSPPASPKPRNGPGVPSPRQASVWFPLPGLGGGGGCPRLGCPPPPSAAAVPAGRSRSMVRRRSGRRRFMGRPEGAAGGSAVTHREPPSDPHPAPAPPPGHDRRPHRPLRVPRPAFLPRPTSPVPPPLRPGPTSHGPCPTALRVRLCPTRGTVPRADGSTLPAAPRRASTVAASRATPRPAFPTARAGLPPRAPPPPRFEASRGRGGWGQGRVWAELRRGEKEVGEAPRGTSTHAGRGETWVLRGGPAMSQLGQGRSSAPAAQLQGVKERSPQGPTEGFAPALDRRGASPQPAPARSLRQGSGTPGQELAPRCLPTAEPPWSQLRAAGAQQESSRHQDFSNSLRSGC